MIVTQYRRVFGTDEQKRSIETSLFLILIQISIIGRDSKNIINTVEKWWLRQGKRSVDRPATRWLDDLVRIAGRTQTRLACDRPQMAQQKRDLYPVVGEGRIRQSERDLIETESGREMDLDNGDDDDDRRKSIQPLFLMRIKLKQTTCIYSLLTTIVPSKHHINLSSMIESTPRFTKALCAILFRIN